MNKFIIILYFIVLSLFTIFSYLFVDSNIPDLSRIYSGFVFSNRFLTTIFYVLFILVFFTYYTIFILWGVRKKIRFKDVFLLVGVTVVALSLSYPGMLSYDIFNYIATSKALFFYHENPYIVMPIEFMGDPLLAFTHAANKIALYGPVWIALTGIPYLLGFGNFIINLFALKLLVGVFYLATTLLVWTISKKIISVALFALNPLIIIETLVSGHNDIVMIFFVLISFFLLSNKKIFLGTLFFSLSIFIKYTTIILMPVFLFIVWKIIKKREFGLKDIFYPSSLLMYIAFLLSPIREEIYPWYAIWFLSFSFLIPNKKMLLYVSLAFSFGLLFRYVPFMLAGTHADSTPVIKSIVTFLPPFLIAIYLVINKKLWQSFFR